MFKKPNKLFYTNDLEDTSKSKQTTVFILRSSIDHSRSANLSPNEWAKYDECDRLYVALPHSQLLHTSKYRPNVNTTGSKTYSSSAPQRPYSSASSAPAATDQNTTITIGRRIEPRSQNRHGRDSRYSQAAVLEVGAMVLQHMFGALSFLQYRADDDIIDRLSYFYTSSFLTMMAVLVSFKQFGGRPLECWVPAQFTASWEAYAEIYCWAKNTYWVPFSEDIPIDIADREYHQISYYQWVPFFLLCEAVLFYIPAMLWRALGSKSGIRLNDIVQMATEKENIEPEYRLRTIESLARHIEAALRYQHAATSRSQYTLHRVFKCFNLRYFESYVTGLYLATKVLYVGNILTNLLLINKFLETDEYSIYGFGVLKDLLFGRSWEESGNFPRVTLCDFEVRVLGNNQRHSVQCVLVINIFNEKIFVLLWLWFSILFVLATLDGLYWFSISLFHRDRLRFILRHLELTSDPDRPELFRKENRKQVEHFLRTYVKVDGVLILRMIALHAGVMYCTEITDALWKRYLSQHPENLIDEDSSLLHFARTQSIRRSRHVVGDNSGSSGSLQPNHNSGQHQRLSRFLSYRQSGSFRNNRQSGSRSLPKKGAETSRTPSPKEGQMIGASQPSQTTVISITPSSRPGSRSSGITSGRLKTLSSSTSSPFDGEIKSKTKFLRRLRLTGSEDKGKQNETTVLL